MITYSIYDLLREYKEYKKTLPEEGIASIGTSVSFIEYLFKKEYPDNLEEILDPGSEADQEAGDKEDREQ